MNEDAELHEDAEAVEPEAIQPEEPEAVQPEDPEAVQPEDSETPGVLTYSEEPEAPLPASDEEEVQPLEMAPLEDEEDTHKDWYILKVQVNRENSIRDALVRRIARDGLEDFFGDAIVPVEDVVEYTKTNKKKIVKKKLYPGYILVHMAINDETWFVVRETPGIGDFTGSGGKPTPMDPADVKRILLLSGELKEDGEEGEEPKEGPRTPIPYSRGDRVRVKDGNFENYEGDVESIDEANGRVVVLINIFNRTTPVNLEYWQVEKL